MAPNEESFLLADGDAGIVRIVSAAGEHSGMGILVRPSLVVTCAHVVNVALGRGIEEPPPPPAGVTVDVAFPLVRGQPAVKARIVEWSPPGGSPINDICLIELESRARPEVGTAIMTDIRGMSLDRDPLSVFGFPPGQGIGRHVGARFVGRANAAWVQIDGSVGNGASIEPGFSGAGVWDRTHECVVGMVVARQVAPDVRIAYMLSARQVMGFSKRIPGERRPLSRHFGIVWTIYSAFVWVLLFTHFLAERLDPYPDWLSLGFGSKVIAGFFGMLLGAFLLPPLLWMLISFARAFREHPWWMRVPAFGALRTPPQPSGRRTATVLSLVFLVLWPLWEQGHFLRRFDNQGEIYIYRTALDDEHMAIETLHPGAWCNTASVHLCTHPEAGRYSTVETGIREDQSYWDNTYHYGDLRGDPPASVTFFPVLEPVVAILLSLLSGLLAIVAGWLIFRPASRSRD